MKPELCLGEYVFANVEMPNIFQEAIFYVNSKKPKALLLVLNETKLLPSG